MNKLLAIACLVMPTVAASGCQDDGSQSLPEVTPVEVITVSDQLAGGAHYNIDLTRSDTIYFLAPNLDASRLSVTCPTLSTISFREYILSRIRPTRVSYDPATDILQLANGSIPREAMNQSAQAHYTCTINCSDNADGSEYCWEECSGEP